MGPNRRKHLQWPAKEPWTVSAAPTRSSTQWQSKRNKWHCKSGWGTCGFKATPVSGKRTAEIIATGQVPDVLRPFRLDRFDTFEQVGERGVGSVGHQGRSQGNAMKIVTARGQSDAFHA